MWNNTCSSGMTIRHENAAPVPWTSHPGQSLHLVESNIEQCCVLSFLRRLAEQSRNGNQITFSSNFRTFRNQTCMTGLYQNLATFTTWLHRLLHISLASDLHCRHVKEKKTRLFARFFMWVARCSSKSRSEQEKRHNFIKGTKYCTRIVGNEQAITVSEEAG